MSCGLLGYNTPADHKMEILRALVKFVNQILRTYCCKKKPKKNWSCHGGFVCRFAHKNKSECPVIIWTRQNLFKAAFPLKLCTRMLFCNKKMGDAGSEACFLRALWNRPALFCPQENVLFSGCLFWLMSAPAKHLHLSFYPSFYHPHTLSDLPNSPLLSFTQDSLSAAHLWRTDASRNVKSASIWLRGCTGVLQEIYVLLRFFQPLPGTIWVLN